MCRRKQRENKIKTEEIDKEQSMQNHKSDKKWKKLAKFLAGCLLILGVILMLTWQKVFNHILFKVSVIYKFICEKCCVIDSKILKLELQKQV